MPPDGGEEGAIDVVWRCFISMMVRILFVILNARDKEDSFHRGGARTTKEEEEEEEVEKDNWMQAESALYACLPTCPGQLLTTVLCFHGCGQVDSVPTPQGRSEKTGFPPPPPPESE